MLTPLGKAWEPLLRKVASDLGHMLHPDRIRSLSQWLDLTVTWNARLDLTAARDANELVDLAIADAVVLADAAAPTSSWLDVGTGAGAPGLALALLRPDLAVTLAEPLQKRVSFLRNVVGVVGASKVRVERARGEQLAAEFKAGRAPHRFDATVSRAVLAPNAWLSLGAQLVAGPGAVWVLLARDEPPTMSGWTASADRTYQWPLTGVMRRAVCYQRVSLSNRP